MIFDHLLSYLFGMDLGLLVSATFLVAAVGIIELTRDTGLDKR